MLPVIDGVGDGDGLGEGDGLGDGDGLGEGDGLGAGDEGLDPEPEPEEESEPDEPDPLPDPEPDPEPLPDPEPEDVVPSAGITTGPPEVTVDVGATGSLSQPTSGIAHSASTTPMSVSLTMELTVNLSMQHLRDPCFRIAFSITRLTWDQEQSCCQRPSDDGADV
jgi:hypothetical protein